MPGTWKNWIIAIFSSSGTPKWEQQIKLRRTRTRSERGKAVNREGTTLIGKSENSPSTTTVPRQNKYAGAFINWSPDTSSTHSPHYNNDCHCLLSSPSDRLGLSNGRTKYRPPTRVFAQSNCKSEIQAEGKVHVKDSRKEHLFRPIILILVSATTDAVPFPHCNSPRLYFKFQSEIRHLLRHLWTFISSHIFTGTRPRTAAVAIHPPSQLLITIPAIRMPSNIL